MRQCNKLFYFGMTIYMFRMVFPSIIRSSRLYIQQQAYVKQMMMDGKTVRNMLCTVQYSNPYYRPMWPRGWVEV